MNMAKKELGNNDRSTRLLPLPTTGNTSSVEASNTASASNNNEVLHTDVLAIQNETLPPGATFAPITTASMSTRRAAKMTPKRATKRDRNKTMKRALDKKSTFAASTMNNNQNDNATEEEISLVSPGAVPVPGTGSSSLGPHNHESANRSELVPPRLADQDQSLVILPAQLVPHHHEEDQQDQDLEHRIEQEVNSRLMKRDPKIVVAEFLPPASTATDQANCCRKWKYVLLFILLGMCGAVAGTIISSQRADETSSPEQVPSTASPPIVKNPSASRTRDEETQAKIRDVLQREANLTFNGDPSNDSPQSQALEWLLFNDTHSLRQNGSVSDSLILERYVLAVLFYSTSGYSWQQRLQFLTNSHACNWNDGSVSYGSFLYLDAPYGVACLEDAKVTAIAIPNNGLNGTIPSELGLLSKLRHIVLSTNLLTGTLPTEVGLCTSMINIMLDNNLLVGKLPTEVGWLANLALFAVSWNYFTGSLPTELGLVTNLYTLEVHINSMKGQLPTQLGNMLRLETLVLANNQFTGTLATEWGRLNRLFFLELENNTLNGTLPTELGNLASLSSLTLANNQFTGTLPTELAKLRDLEEIIVYNNALNGTIPEELAAKAYLRVEFDPQRSP